MQARIELLFLEKNFANDCFLRSDDHDEQTATRPKTYLSQRVPRCFHHPCLTSTIARQYQIQALHMISGDRHALCLDPFFGFDGRVGRFNVIVRVVACVIRRNRFVTNFYEIRGGTKNDVGAT